MLDREILLDTLREDYAQQIIEIIASCQFFGKQAKLSVGLNLFLHLTF